MIKQKQPDLHEAQTLLSGVVASGVLHLFPVCQPGSSANEVTTRKLQRKISQMVSATELIDPTFDGDLACPFKTNAKLRH